MLTLAYVGTQGHRLIAQYDANPGDQALCLQLSNPNNVFPGSPTCGPKANSKRSLSRPENGIQPWLPLGVHLWDQRQAGPNFSQNNSFTANIANSNYNAGEITIERKASDITLLAAYTYSKGIDNSSGFGQWVNFSDFHRTRRFSSYDITHNFVVSYIWALPFDRLFKGAPKRLTRGGPSTASPLRGGLPVPLSEGDDQSLTGSPNTDVPNVVGSVVRLNPRSANPNCPTTNNTGCFFLPRRIRDGSLRAVRRFQSPVLSRPWTEQH